IFRNYANRALLLVAWLLEFFKWIFFIPARLLMMLSNGLIRFVFKASVEITADAFTRSDLQEFVAGKLQGEQDELEAGMFKNALRLKHLKARECMVPRTEIVYSDISDGPDEVKRLFLETQHSRILVSKGDIDNILGYIHHHSLLKEPDDFARTIRTVRHVPEVTSVLDVMALLMRQKHGIAVVVDEFGGTTGIITLEDITEEIVGEIEDKKDQEEYIEEQISETEYLFSARL